MGHHWSGWPGAFCTKCGASQAMENALADNWFDFQGDENNPDMVWKSPVHKELVFLCDTNCSADMSIEAFEKIQLKGKELRKLVEEFDSGKCETTKT